LQPESSHFFYRQRDKRKEQPRQYSHLLARGLNLAGASVSLHRRICFLAEERRFVIKKDEEVKYRRRLTCNAGKLKENQGRKAVFGWRILHGKDAMLLIR
jgi:hypothetical protein